MREQITCPVCTTVFTAPPSHRRKYCSKPCMYVGRTKTSDDLTADYRRKYAPNHPLRTISPVVSVHRIELWDKIGIGPHNCHYCAVSISWFPEKHPNTTKLFVDHLDRDKKNNDPDNLVPTCHRCNVWNTDRHISDDEDFIVRSDRSRLRAIRSRCLRCSKEFLAQAKTYKAKPRQYCSRACRYGHTTPNS